MLTHSDIDLVNKTVHEDLGDKRSNVINTINVSNVKPYNDELLNELLSRYTDKPKGIARIIAEELGDKNNLNFYIRLVKNNNEGVLFESLAIAKNAGRAGTIRTTKARYFVGVLKRKGVKW